MVNRLRLNLSHTLTDAFSFTLAYDFTPRVQDPSLFSQSPIAVGIASSRYRVADLDSPIYPRKDEPAGSVGIYHNLDRASVQFSTDFADFSIGRDAIAWGSARIINPTDIIAPYTYDQLDTEDRVGVDALRIRIPIGVMGEIDTGYIFGNKFNFDKSAIFLRTQLNAVETDFSILLLEFQRDLLVGFDITRGIGGAGFSGWKRLTCSLKPSMSPMHRKTTSVPLLVSIIVSAARRIHLSNTISTEQGCRTPKISLPI